MRAVIGSCFGPRRPVDHLKSWMNINWGNIGIKVSFVQYLPNGYLIFMFEDPTQAQYVKGQGTWLLKNSPLLLQPWYSSLNPRGPRSTIFPVWVDPEMPLQFYTWLKELGNQMGNVKGHKNNINPKWEPQLLIEVDTAKPLKDEILIFDGEGSLLHTQKVLYKNLPNACFIRTYLTLALTV